MSKPIPPKEEKIKVKGVSPFTIFLGFIPYIFQSIFSSPSEFRLVTLVTTAMSVTGIIWGLARKRGVHQLSVVGTIVFGGMLIGSFADDHLNRWFENYAGTISDMALVVTALTGIAIRKPFTLYYARMSVDQIQWEHNPAFRTGVTRVAQIITGVWALYFAIDVASDFAENITHNSLWFNWIVPIAALIAAVKFTIWYPDYIHEKLLREHPEFAEQHRKIAEKYGATPNSQSSLDDGDSPGHGDDKTD